ncbi:glycosyltransferase family 4 protein [Aerococcus viridans]|uniref:glycosyltransferase family 4 protein n=1 Tax=Aerococcus viridans TaxID=1377 RepID=UPI002DB8B727|nr:glycosyltransferase family 4 protein [Aerococcus viridans]MEC1386027.1 glycosyltransferase family 4 protein [Aerococcus viridans]
MGKHILIYSQYFYPEQFRINDIAKELVIRGYKVSVVTGIPNYPEGEFFEGYDWKNNRFETWNGVDIYRMPIVARGKSSLKLVMNYMSFVISSKLRQTKLPQDVDAVFTYEVSPMTQALPAIWFAKDKKVKHTLYVMDLWPENVVAITGISNKFIIKALDKMVNYIYKNTDAILTSSESFKQSIELRGIDADKVIFWPQYAEEIYEVQSKDNIEVDVQIPNVRSFVFAGNVGYAQGLEVLPKAAEKLKELDILVKFIIIGDGRAKEDLQLQIMNLDVSEYFEFIDRQPANKIPYYLAKYDVALVTLSSNEIFNQTIPAKVQSLMACGKPLLVSANGEVQNIITDSKAGLFSNTGDINALVENIIIFNQMESDKISHMASNSIAYSEKHFNKKNLIDRLETILF